MRLLCFILLVVQTSSQSYPDSPCPDIMRYEKFGSQVVGVIEILNPSPDLTQFKLAVKMSIAAELPSSYKGKIVGEDGAEAQKRIDNENMLKYRILFPLKRPLPNIVSIVFNKKVVCHGPSASGSSVTTIDLNHVLKLDLDSKIQPKFILEPISITLPKNNEECGVLSADLTPLIVHGEETSKGDWPWLVAIYRIQKSTPSFICGGSLISNNAVLTAAHCTFDRTNSPVRPSEIVVRLGVFNLQDMRDPTAITAKVKSIKTNSRFRQGAAFNNDIAIFQLAVEVPYNQYIRPVCLWAGDSDPNKVFGKVGVVVGWGQDENRALVTSGPRKVKVPIVSTDECRLSKLEFYKYTSNTTLCAGARDGSGPCRGDSGGGMYVKQNDRWTVRGIVSFALPSAVADCDHNEYTVYTDVAQYTDWIQED